jgi:hypothetical protein
MQALLLTSPQNVFCIEINRLFLCCGPQDNPSDVHQAGGLFSIRFKAGEEVSLKKFA